MKLDIKKTLLLGFGFFGVSIVNIINKTYVAPFLGFDFGLNAEQVGLVITLCSIIIFIIQPVVGSISDKTRTRIGRRKPFILIFAPLAAVSFAVLPFLVKPGMFWYFLAVLIFVTICLALFRTPVIALMPDITPSRFRSQANGLINLMGGVGVVIATTAGAALYAKGASLPFIASAVLLVLGCAVVLIFIQEPRELTEGTREKQPGLLQNLKLVFTDKDRSALFLLLAIFFWFFGYFGVETFFTMYGISVLGLTRAQAGFLLTYLGVSFIIFAVPSGMIAGKIGRRRTIRIGIITLAVILLGVRYMPMPLLKNGVALPALLALAGISWALININSLPMVVDIAPKKLSGSYTGLYYFFSGIAGVLVPVVAGKVIHMAGDNYNTIFVLAPVSLAIAYLCMFFVTRGESQQAEK
ncbi:MAG: MFS transporter [Spirochaetota bacterium]